MHDATVMRVLLVEEGWHSTMMLARGLEDAGCAVTVLTANGTAATCRRRSVQWLSGPSLRNPRFTSHVEELARGFDHIIPLTEPVMAALWDAGIPCFPSTEPWQRTLVRDKHALLDHAAACGIAIPRHVTVDRPDAIELPVVLKGATGCSGYRVRIAETRAELADALARASTIDDRWILQEFVAGPTYLVGGVFDGGRPLRIYAAEKVEQHPPRIGGAIQLRSIADPDLLALGVHVMRALAWTGFASADVMRRADGSYVLLEVNPRPWGSLAGATTAGVELFAPFARLLAGEHPASDLAFRADEPCMIFPRYLNAAEYRTISGARQALRDLRGDQGRDWLDPRFVMHILHRLYWLKRQRGARL